MTRTVELVPDNYRAHTDLANLLVTVRNPDGSPSQDALTQAKIHLDLLRTQQPNSAETHEAWANYYGAQNNIPAAIQEMQQAVAVEPKRSEFYVLLALFQPGSNLPDQAEASFKKALEVDPKSMNAQLALGGFYQSRNRIPEASKCSSSTRSSCPEDPAPRAALVRLLMYEGKTIETESLALQTKKDLSDNPEAIACSATSILCRRYRQSHRRIQFALQRSPQRHPGQEELHPAPDSEKPS